MGAFIEMPPKSLSFFHGEDIWDILFERVPHYIEPREFYVIVVKKSNKSQIDFPVMISKEEILKVHEKLSSLDKNQNCDFDKFVNEIITRMLSCMNHR